MDGNFFLPSVPPPAAYWLQTISQAWEWGTREGFSIQNQSSVLPRFQLCCPQVQGVLEMLTVSKSPPKWPGGGGERAVVCALFLLWILLQELASILCSCVFVSNLPTHASHCQVLVTQRKKTVTWAHYRKKIPDFILASLWNSGQQKVSVESSFSAKFGRD